MGLQAHDETCASAEGTKSNMMQPDHAVIPVEPRVRPTRILLIEDNPGDVRLVQEKLATQQIAAFKLVAAASLGEALTRLAAEPFDAVMLDLSLPDAQGLEAVRRIRQQNPRTPIVVLTGLSDSAMAIQAVREGAQDYLVKGEANSNALALCLRFAVERYNGTGVQTPSPDLPQPCQALGFIGCKGGTGTSTIASQLGILLQAQTNESVLVADFDFESGVLDFLMEVEPKYSLMSALENVNRLDANIWSSLVSTKTAGLDIISAPTGLAPETETSPEQFRQLLSFLRGSYRWIVADLGRGARQHAGHLLDAFDSLYLISTFELTALRQARLMVRKLEQMGCRHESIRVVLNEMPKWMSFSMTDIEKILGAPIWATLPRIPELRESSATPHPRPAALMKAVGNMVEGIAGVQQLKSKAR